MSAVQHAVNLKLDRGEPAFWAEYQNEPLPEEHADDDLMTADQIAAKVNGLKRGEVPIGCTHLTMFVDVQGKALFWLVAAWEDDFTGNVIDYGTEPDQKTAYFTLRDIRHTLASSAARAGLEGSIYAGLERLTEAMLGREWRRDDGAMVRIDRCLIDANWGSSTDVVYQFCRQSKYASVVMPSHGRYVGASSIPFADYKRKRGDRVGLNWRIPVVTGKRSVRHALFDTNYWKSFIHARLSEMRLRAFQSRVHTGVVGRPDHSAPGMPLMWSTDHDFGAGSLSGLLYNGIAQTERRCRLQTALSFS